MKVLGIDPGYERLGIAIIEKKVSEKENLLYSACIRTSSKESFSQRLLTLGEHIERVIQEFSPDALAIENLYLSNNQKTAMRVAEVRGMILFLAMKHGLIIEEFNPLQIKLAITGDGKSTKEQIMKMVALLIKIANKQALDDEFDAIAVGLSFFALGKDRPLQMSNLSTK